MLVFVLNVLILFCHGCVAELNNGDRSHVFVSRIRGKDLRRCGTKDKPCQSLKIGFQKLSQGGHLYLDGQGTDQDPYACESVRGKLQVKKSFTMQNYTNVSHISCPGGVYFKASGNNVTNVHVKGITFQRTNITLADSLALFDGCTFESSTVIIKISYRLPLYLLNVSNSLFIKNKDRCLSINADNGECNSVVMDFQHVVFQENNLSSNALIELLGSRTTSCKTVSVTSMWEDITFMNNTNLLQQIDATAPYDITGSIFMVHAHIIHLRFSRVKTRSNQNMRFLGFLSHYSNIYVYKSSFNDHQVKKEGGVMYMSSPQKKKTEINVVMIDSRFNKNVATHGAVLYVVDKGNRRTVNLQLVNITIQESYGSQRGCVFSVDSVSSIYASVSGLELSRCHSPCGKRQMCKNRHSGLCFKATRDVHIDIQDSRFMNNVNGSSVFIYHKMKTSSAHGTLNVTLRNCQFKENVSPQFSEIASFTVLVATSRVMRSSHLTVLSSRFDEDKGALKITNVESIKVKNLTCYGVRRFCVNTTTATIRKRDFQNSSILIEDSTFRHSELPIYFFNKHPKFLLIQITNSTFYKNDFDKVVSLTIGRVHKNGIYTSGKILLDGVRFQSNSLAYTSSYLLWINASHKGHIRVQIQRSVFKDNYQRTSISDTINAMVLFYLPKDFNMQAGCRGFPEYQYNNTVAFHDVLFENNTGSLSLVYLSNGNTSFSNCRFKNNFSRRPEIAGHVYVEDQGTGSLKIENTAFTQTEKHLKRERDRLMQFVYAGAKGPLILKNSTFESNVLTRMKRHLFTIQYGGFVAFDNKTELLCPVGSTMLFENLSRLFQPNVTTYQCPSNITRFKYTCSMCPEGLYSLQRGLFHGSTMKKTSLECLPCPFGGNCSWKIETRPNFWGYFTSKHPPELKFTRCPEKYCRPPVRNSPKINGCYGNRCGIMCGSCKRGYTESMFNRNCRAVSECRDGGFWAIAGTYLLILVIYVIHKPSIGDILIDKIFWFKKTTMAVISDREISSKHRESSGYSKLIFYFYQIADLLNLQPFHEVLRNHTRLITFIISFYNFEIERIDAASGCPFPGLTAVTKELFRSLQVFAAMAVVLVFYCLHYLACLITKKPTPLAALYVASVIEILLLGYERLAHTSLELLNCRPLSINGRTKWVLFLDGNITCWVHWWQFALIAYNVIFVVPFLVVLLIGTSKLRRQEITSLHFVAACFVPLPFLMYWIVKRFYKNTGSQPVDSNYQEIRTALLDVLQGPFRSPNELSNGALYWESVLIGRRLVLLGFRFLVASAMFRLLPMTLVIVAILVHESVVMPYKDRKANVLSVMTLSMVIVIATINLCKSALVSSGVTPNRRSKGYFEKLKFVEIFLFCILPFSVLLLAACAALSQVARLSIILFHYMKYILRRFLIPGFGNSRQTESNESERLLTCPTEELSSAETMLTYDSYLNQ